MLSDHLKHFCQFLCLLNAKICKIVQLTGLYNNKQFKFHYYILIKMKTKFSPLTYVIVIVYF